MENETKSILFKGSKTSIKFNISCKVHLVKKQLYRLPGCLLDNNLNGESMARKIPPPPPPQKKMHSECILTLCMQKRSLQWIDPNLTLTIVVLLHSKV